MEGVTLDGSTLRRGKRMLGTALACVVGLVLTGGCVVAPRERSEPDVSVNPSIEPARSLQAYLVDRVLLLGDSVEGRPILVHHFRRGPERERVLIFAAIHGDETATDDLAIRLIETIRGSPDVLPLGTHLVVVPIVNPDGLEQKRRQNARMVDLNRNFPGSNWREGPRGRFYNGPSPLSEPESRLLHDLVMELKPDRILAIHSMRGRTMNNFDGPAEGIARAMSKRNGYVTTATVGYPTPGSFGTWAGRDLGIPTVTLEILGGESADRAWPKNREALLSFVRGEVAASESD